jgi:hypothetical protein
LITENDGRFLYSSYSKIESIERYTLISAVFPKKINFNPDKGIYLYSMNPNLHETIELVIGMF